MKTYTMKDLERFDASDVAKMSRAELAKLVSAFASTANKRIKALQETYAGEYAPALSAVKVKSKNWTKENPEYDIVKISVKGKTQGQLQAEFARVKRFLGHETSTVGGFKKVRKHIQEQLGFAFKDLEEEKEFWRIYKRIRTDNKQLVENVGSPPIYDLIYEYMTADRGFDHEEIVNKIFKQYENSTIIEEDIPDWYNI